MHAYRDALFDQIARLEAERLPARARANRIARVKQRRLVRRLLLVLLPLVLFSLLYAGWEGLHCSFHTALRRQARVDAQTIREVVVTWRDTHPLDCPTFARLVEEKELSAGSKRTDPWDHSYVIRCPGDVDATVTSAGPDGMLGTADDIVADGTTGDGQD